MALQMNWTTVNGVHIEDAYVTAEIFKSKNFHKSAYIYILIYNSAGDKGKGCADTRRVMIPSNHSLYAQYFSEARLMSGGLTDTAAAYNFIKSLDGTEINGINLEVKGIDFTNAANV